jgi:hypothetical protein
MPGQRMIRDLTGARVVICLGDYYGYKIEHAK